MVRMCCICKLENGAVDDISFHGIPTNEEVRAEWYKTIGREVNKHSTICSKHFEDTDFIYKVVGNNVKRFLISTAVPSVLLTQSNSVQNKNIKLNNSTCHNSGLEANLSNDSHWSVDDEEDEENSTKRKTDDELSASTSTKRQCNARCIRDLCREDFTSDLSYNIVQNFVTKARQKQKVLNETVNRLNLKVESYQLLLDHFKKKSVKSVQLNTDTDNASSKQRQSLINIELDHDYLGCKP